MSSFLDIDEKHLVHTLVGNYYVMLGSKPDCDVAQAFWLRTTTRPSRSKKPLSEGRHCEVVRHHSIVFEEYPLSFSKAAGSIYNIFSVIFLTNQLTHCEHVKSTVMWFILM